MAAAAPSFNTWMVSMSAGLRVVRPLLEKTPSITYRGSVAVNDAAPRTTMFTSAPAMPPCCTTSTPAARPCRAEATLDDVCLTTSFEEIVATEEDIFERFWVP